MQDLLGQLSPAKLQSVLAMLAEFAAPEDQPAPPATMSEATPRGVGEVVARRRREANAGPSEIQ